LATEKPATRARVLDPATVDAVSVVGDAAVADALVSAEVALVRAQAALGMAPKDVADRVSDTFGWDAGEGTCRDHGIDPAALAEAAPSSGSPVMALVAAMHGRAGDELAPWIHRGATSQDVLDTALMSLAVRAASIAAARLETAAARLGDLASAERDTVAVARTLTQHAGPTTVGLRAAGWVRALRRASARLRVAAANAPAQLAGSSGTLASYVDLAEAAGANGAGSPRAHDAAAALPAAFAAQLGLAAPDAPWHTTRWPVTEIGDALVQAVDACGAFATDVATLVRPEIGELTTGDDGRSTAMPHKRNPTSAVLIRSAAVRAPHLGAALHSAAALAGDERPDGPWHAEWPTLQDLLSVALGAASLAERLASSLGVDRARVAANVALSGGLLLSERLSIRLAPVIGADGVERIVAAVAGGADLAEALGAEPGLEDVDIETLLDPANATGLAARLVDEALSGEEAS